MKTPSMATTHACSRNEKHNLCPLQLTKAGPRAGLSSWGPASSPRLSKPAGPPHSAWTTHWAIHAPARTRSHTHTCACTHSPGPRTRQEASGQWPPAPGSLSPGSHSQEDTAWSGSGPGQPAGLQHSGPREVWLRPPPGGPPCTLQRVILFQMCLSKNIPFLCILTPRPRARACFRRERRRETRNSLE